MNHAQEHLQREGRACYKRQEYRKALEHFDRAVGRAPSVQLLDNRAACHEKLSDLPLALKDAKKAIQLQREDPTGYLRAGKVLVKMEKQSVALEIYSHGLKCVKHVGQGYERLREVHKELMKELSPPTSVDPLTVLPRELAELILQHLNFRQRINACLVSKQWTQFIRSCPDLWRHLDLSGAKRKVRTAFVSRAINVARQKLVTATLSNVFDFDKVLTALIRHCRLQELTLLEVGLQSGNLVNMLKQAKSLKTLRLRKGTLIGSESLTSILQGLNSQLEDFESTAGCDIIQFHPQGPVYPKLASIHVATADISAFFARINELPAQVPNLRQLIVWGGTCYGLGPGPFDLTALTQLERLDVPLLSNTVQEWMFPTSLRALRLRRIERAMMRQPPAVNDGSLPERFLPELDELALDMSETSAGNVVKLLSGSSSQDDSTEPPIRCCQLHRLELLSPLTSLDGLDGLLSHSRVKNLRHLTLRPMPCDDQTVDLIVAKLRDLETLDLSGTSITGVGLKRILGLPILKVLTVNDCRYLGRDAVDWARSQGLKVEFSTIDGTKGGKKVRY